MNIQLTFGRELTEDEQNLVSEVMFQVTEQSAEQIDKNKMLRTALEEIAELERKSSYMAHEMALRALWALNE